LISGEYAFEYKGMGEKIPVITERVEDNYSVGRTDTRPSMPT